jgi:hypothetical protein
MSCAAKQTVDSVCDGVHMQLCNNCCSMPITQPASAAQPPCPVQQQTADHF